jgi:hypothetical protein
MKLIKLIYTLIGTNPVNSLGCLLKLLKYLNVYEN